MNDETYRLIAGLFDAFLWGGELVGAENLPENEPVVYVANHLGALGPIAVIASLPVRVYPWVIADMLDHQVAAAYLNQDFCGATIALGTTTQPVVVKTDFEGLRASAELCGLCTGPSRGEAARNLPSKCGSACGRKVWTAFSGRPRAREGSRIADGTIHEGLHPVG